MEIKLTYGITVCDEHEELDRLLSHLVNVIDEEDEVIVLRDMQKTNAKVTKVIVKYFDIFKNRFLSLDASLNKDFATFKNNLIENATGDYLFQIDADEIPNEFLIHHIKPIITINKDVDAFYIPRVNKVLGITQEHIQKWKWHVDEQERINYPDPQMRLFKLGKDIKWKNKVHEVLENCIITTILPYEEHEDFCLYHIKTIGKQEQQNNFYGTI
jgi:hypothetical protein